MKILEPDYNAAILIHLAIKAYDLEKAKTFYCDVMGATAFRIMEDRITFGLKNMQLVCHLTKEDVLSEKASFYPNHFGFTFRNIAAYDEYYDRMINKFKEHVHKLETIRFKDRADEHRTFILLDPSNNFIEIKCYLKNHTSF